LPVKRIQLKADRRERYGTGQRARTIELPEEVHITPRMYQKLTQKIAGKPEERILSYLMLRSLKQARYSAENEGHFALAAPSYTHFTSPIRRYPDLIVHRILKEVLRDSAELHEAKIRVGVHVGRPDESPSPWSRRETPASTSHKKKRADEGPKPLGGPIPEMVLQEIAGESSQSERRADEAERELMEWKKAKFMEQHLGDEFDGLIVSVTKFGFFVELTDMFIEGLVPIASLPGDHYVFHENTRQIIGQRTRKAFSIGEPIRVQLERIDAMQKRLQFGIIEEKARKTATKKRRMGGRMGGP
jgi:ribonuclease R